jgi:hypothetical protein
LKEWKGVDRKTIVVLIVGILILIASTFIVKLTFDYPEAAFETTRQVNDDDGNGCFIKNLTF